MAQPLRRSQRLKEKREKSESTTNVDIGKNKKAINAIKGRKAIKNVDIGKNKKYWLMKSEPNSYSIDDLEDEGEDGDYWDGIRNYQVRNMIRDEIKCFDEALFYHSCCKPPGIAGSMIITKESYPDFTAFNKKEKYYDPKSNQNNPRWFMFNVKFKSKFKNFITLNQLKQIKELENMKILQKGNRLSITQITKDEYHLICQFGHK